jgi:hypothetical protein
LDERSVVLSADASGEVRLEVDAVSVVEETHTGADTIVEPI